MAELVQVPAVHELQDNSYWLPDTFALQEEKNLLNLERKKVPGFEVPDLKFTAATNALEDTASQTPVICRCTSLKFYPTKPEFRWTKKRVFFPGHFSDTDKVLVSFYLLGMKEV